MAHFDDLMLDLDTIQDETFAIEVSIDGSTGYCGVFSEQSDEFEGVGTMYRTIKFTENSAPSLNSIENGMTVVKLVNDGRAFTVHQHDYVDGELVFELR